jgi:hypothetical protein
MRDAEGGVRYAGRPRSQPRTNWNAVSLSCGTRLGMLSGCFLG